MFREDISIQSRMSRPTQMDIFIVPLAVMEMAVHVQYAVISEYFASTVSLFPQVKLENKSIMVFSELYGQVMLDLKLFM